jgi:hypothetical protein
MFNFQYEIHFAEDGRPFIEPVGLTTKEMSFIEHKFMCLEITRTFISQTVLSHQQKGTLPSEELDRLIRMEGDLIRVSNVLAKTIKDQKDLLNIADRLINKNYDVSVNSIEERNALNYEGFIFDDRIYKRVEGLKVKVLNTGEIFELIGGVDNEHWTKL